MLIWNLLRYYYYRIYGLTKLRFDLDDFIDQGIGLELRSKSYKKYWSPHLKQSKDFILDSLAILNKQNSRFEILVIGAGRLNDFPTEEILRRGNRLVLVDLDPSNLAGWSRLKKQYPDQVQFVIADVTGRFVSWSALLKAGIDSPNLYLEVGVELSPILDRQFDFIVSLNILSQLRVFWEDRVRNILPQAKSKNLTSLIDQTSSLLEQEHSNFLKTKSIVGFCLIADEYFHYYMPNKSLWQTELATSIDRSLVIPELEKKLESTWLWHLRPAGKEKQEYGEIHKVLAQLYMIKTMPRL